MPLYPTTFILPMISPTEKKPRTSAAVTPTKAQVLQSRFRTLETSRPLSLEGIVEGWRRAAMMGLKYAWKVAVDLARWESN